MMFDMRTGVVLAQTSNQENIKEKVTAVRTIVPMRSKNEVLLVLQHFDYSVDRTVQAFLEDEVGHIFKEWNVSGKKKNPKKKKPKPVASEVKKEAFELDNVSTAMDNFNGDVAQCTKVMENQESLPEVEEYLEPEVKVEAVPEPEPEFELDLDSIVSSATSEDREIEQVSSNDVLSEPLESLSLSQGEPAHLQASISSSNMHGKGQRGQNRTQSGTKGSRSRNTLRTNVPHSVQHPELTMYNTKKTGSSIEKSVKDLQRCTVSLNRYRMLVKQEIDVSIKKIKVSFYDVQQSLMDREVSLLGELDKVKKEAITLLDSRQKKAAELKKLCDASKNMSPAQLSDLRAEIKHFVSERKYDEEVGKTARFTCDPVSLIYYIEAFGEISSPRLVYPSKSRCSSVSSTSLPPSTPTVPDACSAGELAQSVEASAANMAASLLPASRTRPLSMQEEQLGTNGRLQGFHMGNKGLHEKRNDTSGHGSNVQLGNKNRHAPNAKRDPDQRAGEQTTALCDTDISAPYAALPRRVLRRKQPPPL
uniref:spermatogenesis-associated serine-rich protein 2-like n=1 Tax=Myxine glutinosa TaxID=7769 RepID=UPI00358E9A51